MELRILAVGDVVGLPGLSYLSRHLRSLKQLYKIDFCVVNGENANGVGILPRQADLIFDAGADVITLGNHTFGRREICPYLDDQPLYPPPGEPCTEPSGARLGRVRDERRAGRRRESDRPLRDGLHAGQSVPRRR